MTCDLITLTQVLYVVSKKTFWEAAMYLHVQNDMT
jgi:hypothetical protein